MINDSWNKSNLNLTEAAGILNDLNILKENLNDFYLLVNAFMIMFMQCGFAFLECGAVRSKNATNILMKNILDTCVAGISYWLIGFPLAFGDTKEIGNPIIGYKYWGSYGLSEKHYSFWFFQFVLGATASTIISGAVAERCEFVTYIVYSSIIPGFVYPVVSHWVWSYHGWLKNGFEYNDARIVYIDFAGSGPVHLLGGTAALIATIYLGPRRDKFDRTGAKQDVPGHSVPLVALGGFILMFGFFAFNVGSQGGIVSEKDGMTIGRSALITVLCGSSSAVAGLIYNRLPCLGTGNWSLLTTINCMLAGLVASCAGCNSYHPWSSIVVGFVAAMIHQGISRILVRYRIDDPLDAVAVHGGGGLWGVVAVGIFSIKDGLVFRRDVQAILQLLWQLTGALSIILWSVSISLPIFGVLRWFNVLRVSPEIEMKGLDIPEHGEPAYPITAYGHGWSHYNEKGQTKPTLNLAAAFLPWLKESANNTTGGVIQMETKGMKEEHGRIESGKPPEGGGDKSNPMLNLDIITELTD